MNGRYILLIIALFVFISCSKDTDDETAITDTLENLYKSLNHHNYKEIEALSSENMLVTLREMKRYIDGFVQMKNYSVTEVDIQTDMATATVESTDIYGNVVTNSWDLIKEHNVWKVNNFNFSNAQNIPNTHASIVNKEKLNNQNVDTTKAIVDTINKE